MIALDVPGYDRLEIEHLVCDYTGTLSVGGDLRPGVADRLLRLSEKVMIRVLTADTFGRARRELSGLPCEVQVHDRPGIDAWKEETIRDLGADRVLAIGNGRNDRLMLERAALGIAVVLEEGAAAATLAAADVVVTRITDGLQLLRRPGQLIATLRS